MGNEIQHKCFISYHHKNDQEYKNKLVDLGKKFKIFIDYSVDTGEIDENLPSQTIRTKIRDEYLRDSTVTILLVGTETKNRKHVDWELYSSMYDGSKNKKSGILVIQLPSSLNTSVIAPHELEKKTVYPDYNWIPLKTRKDYNDTFPLLPDRIIDNLISEDVKISVTTWNIVYNNPEILRYLIEIAHKDKIKCNYDLSRQMRG